MRQAIAHFPIICRRIGNQLLEIPLNIRLFQGILGTMAQIAFYPLAEILRFLLFLRPSHGLQYLQPHPLQMTGDFLNPLLGKHSPRSQHINKIAATEAFQLLANQSRIGLGIK